MTELQAFTMAKLLIESYGTQAKFVIKQRSCEPVPDVTCAVEIDWMAVQKATDSLLSQLMPRLFI